MTIEDKKLIAEWMGWREYKDGRHALYFVYDGREQILLKDWNPDTDRNCWPEITSKMSVAERIIYIRKLMELFGYENTTNTLQEFDTIDCFRAHTAPPDICTKALLEVIKPPEE